MDHYESREDVEAQRLQAKANYEEYTKAHKKRIADLTEAVEVNIDSLGFWWRDGMRASGFSKNHLDLLIELRAERLKRLSLEKLLIRNGLISEEGILQAQLDEVDAAFTLGKSS